MTNHFHRRGRSIPGESSANNALSERF